MLFIKANHLFIPSVFFLWRWTENDHSVPLQIDLDENIKVDFFIEYDDMSKIIDRKFAMNSNLAIYVKNPKQSLLDSFSNNSDEAAQFIYSCYAETIRRFVLYARISLNTVSILDGNVTFGDLYQERYFKNFSWSTDGSNYKPFVYTPKKIVGINPLFKSKNLISPKVWKRLQVSFKKIALPSKETEELLRFKTKAQWNEKRIAIVESVAIIELLIRSKVGNIIGSKGFNIKRLDELKKDIGLSVLLNIAIPSALTKAELSKYSKYIKDVDKLNSIRNKVMHENLENKLVDKDLVIKGISSSIKLLQFLNKKFG